MHIICSQTKCDASFHGHTHTSSISQTTISEPARLPKNDSTQFRKTCQRLARPSKKAAGMYAAFDVYSSPTIQAKEITTLSIRMACISVHNSIVQWSSVLCCSLTVWNTILALAPDQWTRRYVSASILMYVSEGQPPESESGASHAAAPMAIQGMRATCFGLGAQPYM